MDGERMVPAEGLLHDRRGVGRATTRRPRTFLWLLVVGLLLAVVLGGLYGFNRFREQAIATYFANNKPPPAHVSAAEVKTEAIPRFATGIGSVTAVHQVTINPEIGGRVTKIFFEPGALVKAGDPSSSSTMRRNAAISSVTRRRRAMPKSHWSTRASSPSASSRHAKPSTRSRASSTKRGR